MSSAWKKIGVFALVVGAFLFLYLRYGEAISLQSLAQQEGELRTYQRDNPWLVYGVAFVIYVVFTGLSIPGAVVLSLVYGWYFGLWSGVLLVSFASTFGATFAFLLSRYLFRDAIQRRFGDRLADFNRSLQREGPFYLFTLRLIPAVPFFAINVVMGLTPIRVTTYYWVSQLGMLPMTFVYLYAGSRVPTLQRLAEQGIQAVFSPSQLLQLTVAFVLLGVFPLIVRFIVDRVGKKPAAGI